MWCARHAWRQKQQQKDVLIQEQGALETNIDSSCISGIFANITA